MAKCNNNISVASLPTSETVDVNDYLIVYNNVGTNKVRFSDIVFGAENVDFYPELEQIITSLETISSVVIPGSGNWNSVYNTVNSNSATWSSLLTGNIPNLLGQLETKVDKWDDVSTAVETSSGSWNSAVSTDCCW